jgi:hypothetical protein
VLGADMPLMCGMGAETRDELPARAPDEAITAGCGDMRWVTIPRSCTFCDSFGKFPSWPRGTPNPAELFRTTSLLPVNVDAVPRFTTTVLVPVAGACGTVNPFGAFNTRGWAYQVFQAPPGCQPQPYPGMNAHDP